MGILVKKYLACLVLWYFVFSTAAHAAQSVMVVANTGDQSIQLNRQQVRSLFMGGVIPYQLKAVALPPENHTRVLFNTKIIGLTESRIQSYWAQMRFTGRKRAPREFENETSLLQFLLRNVGATGYLPAGMDVPDQLTVIYTIP